MFPPDPATLGSLPETGLAAFHDGGNLLAGLSVLLIPGQPDDDGGVAIEVGEGGLRRGDPGLTVCSGGSV